MRSRDSILIGHIWDFQRHDIFANKLINFFQMISETREYLQNDMLSNSFTNAKTKKDFTNHSGHNLKMLRYHKYMMSFDVIHSNREHSIVLIRKFWNFDQYQNHIFLSHVSNHKNKSIWRHVYYRWSLDINLCSFK